MAIAEVGSGTQRAQIRGTSVDTAGVAFPANVTSGNLLICAGAFWVAGAGGLTCPVTDTLTTSWTSLVGTGTEYSGGVGQSFIAYAIAGSSGANTVTVNPSNGGAYISAVIDEFSGVHATPLEVDGGGSGGTGTSVSGGITTLTSGALLVGSILTDGVPAGGGAGFYTATGGLTLMDEDETNDRQPYAAAFKIVGAAGPYTLDWTLTETANWRIYRAAFAAAGGAPPADSLLHTVLRPRAESRGA